MKEINKKGQIFGQLGALGTGILALAITLVVVFLVLAEVKANSTVAADANATLSTATLTTAAGDIPGWVGIVVIAVIGALLLGLVQLFRQGRQG